MSKSDDILKNLNGLKKETPFNVPEGYFDDFARKMQDRIAEEKSEKKSFIFSLNIKPQVIFAYTFSIIVLIFGSLWIMNIDKNGSISLSEDVIAEIIDDNIVSYDESIIVDAFIESGAGFSEIHEEEEYDLELDNIDLESLLNEL